METETLQAMNEGLYRSLLMGIEVIVLITVFFTLTGFAIYLVGIARLCFEEIRRSKTAPRASRHTAPPNIGESVPRVPNTSNSTAFNQSNHTALPHFNLPQ